MKLSCGNIEGNPTDSIEIHNGQVLGCHWARLPVCIHHNRTLVETFRLNAAKVTSHT